MPAYLIWDDIDDAEDDARTSLEAVDLIYGLPYTEGNYVMNTWAEVTNSDTNTDEWGFYKPEVRLGKLLSALMAVLVGAHFEVAEIPDDWVII